MKHQLFYHRQLCCAHAQVRLLQQNDSAVHKQSKASSLFKQCVCVAFLVGYNYTMRISVTIQKKSFEIHQKKRKIENHLLWNFIRPELHIAWVYFNCIISLRDKLFVLFLTCSYSIWNVFSPSFWTWSTDRGSFILFLFFQNYTKWLLKVIDFCMLSQRWRRVWT